MASVTMAGLVKSFDGRRAVDGVSLDVANGEFMAILGPSGCGKSTLLRLLAGFERLDEGRIAFGDETVSGPGTHVVPEARGIGMVFQSYALWPHMSVEENVAFALRMRKVPRAEAGRRVARVLETVGLGPFGGRRPAELSGGQRQRVALARCLAIDPRLILMDEPLSNLDAPLREAMHVELRRLHAGTGSTILYVTHDQDEAMALADRIAILHEGRLQQVGRPETLYCCPGNRVVANFFGRGVVLPVEAVLAENGARVNARIFGNAVDLRWNGRLADRPAASVKFEDMAIVADGDASGFPAAVDASIFSGKSFRLRARPLAAPDLVLSVRASERRSEGAQIRIRITDGYALPG